MTALEIEYIELYSNDMQSVVDYFTLSVGFIQVAESVDHSRNSVLLRQGDAQLVVTAGPVTEKFLDAHGDGIANIAVICDDVHSALFRQAPGRGCLRVAPGSARPPLRSSGRRGSACWTMWQHASKGGH
jgi:4-hydroxymandelate synthase